MIKKIFILIKIIKNNSRTPELNKDLKKKIYFIYSISYDQKYKILETF
jgi:hypothetical protein